MDYKFDKNGNADFLEDKAIAIVVGYFYQDIGDKLLAGAREILEKYGARDDNIDVFYAPGAFEIPLIAKKITQASPRKHLKDADIFLRSPTAYAGIITLGAVIDGETPHFDYVCSECARGVADVSYQSEIPTTFGVITAQNMAQAQGRAGGYKGNKGEEAALAMVEMLYLLGKI